METIFSSFKEEMEQEQQRRDQIREVVRLLDQKSRDIVTILQKVHQSNGNKQVIEICQKAKEAFDAIRTDYCKLTALVPENEYFKYFLSICSPTCDKSTTAFYRYNDHFRFLNQRLAYLAAMIKYLESDQMISLEEAAAFIGVKADQKQGFHLDLDDYLFSVLTLSTELARFSINCVTSGDYERPFKIAEFLSDLDSGFRLLNLKNDNLRKRFDALKYDVKKVEEVVYDLTIRGLKSRAIDATKSQ
uniref:Translin n=1 Tax=Romanomermis culicivorax TaxID=13658 RepID=A0A915K424_ROMCU